VKALISVIIITLMSLSLDAKSECNTPHIAREAINNMASLFHPEKITDLVGYLVDSGRQKSYNIWANYNNKKFSDKYEITIDPINCTVLSLSIIEKNSALKTGNASWDFEIQEIAIKTKIDPSTLFITPLATKDPTLKYKTSLMLPDLSSYIITPHTRALRIDKKYSTENETRKLVSELLEQSSNSGDYLDVRYTIFRKKEYKEVPPNPMSHDTNVACTKKSEEIITATFQNGLVLKSVKTRHFGRVLDSFCFHNEE